MPTTINATGTCTAGNPYIQNTYDTSFIDGSSDFPKGQLTKSVATIYYPEGGSPATATEKFAHDQRGRLFQNTAAPTRPTPITTSWLAPSAGI